MRWEPFELILFFTTLSTVVILASVRTPRQRHHLLLSVGYLFGLSVILFTPLSFDGTAVYVMPAGTGQVNLTRWYLHGLGFIENIVLTVPLGWGLKHYFKRISLVGAAGIGLFIGASIESLQYVMSQHWLINRSSDINDVIANAAGILLGTALAGMLQFMTRHRKATVADY